VQNSGPARHFRNRFLSNSQSHSTDHHHGRKLGEYSSKFSPILIASANGYGIDGFFLLIILHIQIWIQIMKTDLIQDIKSTCLHATRSSILILVKVLHILGFSTFSLNDINDQNWVKNETLNPNIP